MVKNSHFFPGTAQKTGGPTPPPIRRGVDGPPPTEKLIQLVRTGPTRRVQPNWPRVFHFADWDPYSSSIVNRGFLPPFSTFHFLNDAETDSVCIADLISESELLFWFQYECFAVCAPRCGRWWPGGRQQFEKF